MNKKYDKNDIAWLKEQAEKRIQEDIPYQISEYIEGRRIMPPGTPFPGPFENSRTPYAVEIMDCLSPYSDTQFVDIMSAAQVVKTTIMENVIGYYTGADPSPILIISGTGDLLERWSTKRLEPLIDSLGLRQYFKAPIETAKARSTGDKAKQKLFPGGFIEMASAQSPASMRSDSIRILLMDECDEAPPLLSSGEGYWDEVAEARTSAWGIKKKVLAASTPKEYNNSTIYRRFLLGDQCEYFCKCPRCGKYILLERGGEDLAWGLRAEKKNGIIQYIYYLCNECHDIIYEHEKGYLIQNGKWIPKTTPQQYRRSFHMNALIAPQGGFSWRDYWGKYQEAQQKDTLDSMRAFTNLRDGRVYIASGEKPKAEKVMQNRGKYQSGEVPDGVLYLTAGIDVQRGSKKDPKNPPRIEMEILGIGYAYKTWSIDYLRFEGGIKNIYDGAWKLLQEYALKTGLKYKRREDGYEFPVQLIFIDSGDGENTQVVYDFCSQWSNTFPIKGQQTIKSKKTGKPEQMTESGMIPYKRSKINSDIEIYTISTILYKDKIYNNLTKKRIPGDIQQNEFCDFPQNYADTYFKMLTAEEKLMDGTYESYGRRNEALDCRVYSLCAGDVWLDDQVRKWQQYYKSQGQPENKIRNEIKKRWVIDKLIEATKIQKAPN